MESAEYLVTRATSVNGWSTVTLVPLRVECERILRSVSMDVYALGGTGVHGHGPAKVSCDKRDGHFSVRVSMDSDTDAGFGGEPTKRRSVISVPAGSKQNSHGPGDGHGDHQHVLYVFHDLE